MAVMTWMMRTEVWDKFKYKNKDKMTHVNYCSFTSIYCPASVSLFYTVFAPAVLCTVMFCTMVLENLFPLYIIILGI